MTLPSLPQSWSSLSWQQLCLCWHVKIRYGGNPDVARVATMLALLGCSVCRSAKPIITNSGETLYRLRDKDGCLWTVTAREASQMAKQVLPWFDYPYGDPGEKEVRDEKGKVVKEGREAVVGYVSPMHDALILPIDTLAVCRGKMILHSIPEQCSPTRSLSRFKLHSKTFALPQVACNNLTWQQYRALQTITPQLFSENVTDEQAIDLQAQFLAHCLVPRTRALLDTSGGSIRIRPHYEYRYNAEQADGMVKWWKKNLKQGSSKDSSLFTLHSSLLALFHICLQCYQTALTYYAIAYPLLFSGESKSSQVRDALQGEVGTINTIMKYAGYAEQQQVYDSNLPFVLDILNTMTKEAKEIEKMNAKIKKK